MIRKYTKIEMWKANELVSRVFLLIVILVAACSPEQSKEDTNPVIINVNSAGKLMEIMHEGKVDARVSLDTLKMEHLYGLGALAALKGELTVIDGRPYVATVDSLGAYIRLDAAAKAALFVYAYVPAWDTLALKGVDDIVKMIEKERKRQSIKGAMPFMILAQPNQLNYHIINFSGDQPNKSNHKIGALSGVLTDRSVSILGFYSENSQGVYTHHDSKIHMHFLNESKELSGHIDSLNITDRPIKLLIPSL